MKVNKEFEGLIQKENGDYVLKGDLISEESIEIDLDDRLFVRGSVISKMSIKVGRTLIASDGIKAGRGIIAGCGIKAGGGIEAGEGIKAGEGIEAGWGIKADCGIEAGEGIEAGSFIQVEKRIFAGVSVYGTVESCKKTITCAELRKGEICYGDLILTDNQNAEKETEDART